LQRKASNNILDHKESFQKCCAEVARLSVRQVCSLVRFCQHLA